MFELAASRRVLAALALTTAGGGACCAVALAAHPTKGATYSGQITRVIKGSTVNATFPISFKATKNGKQVTGFVFTSFYPVYCQGGGFGSPQSRKASVSKQGTFKVKLPLVFAPTHQHQGNLIITGKFGRHGSESGTVTTAFTASKSCNGKAKYKTKTG